MASWTHILRFTAAEDGKASYAKGDSTLPQIGAKVAGFTTLALLETGSVTEGVKTIKEVSFDDCYMLRV